MASNNCSRLCTSPPVSVNGKDKEDQVLDHEMSEGHCSTSSTSAAAVVTDKNAKWPLTVPPMLSRSKRTSLPKLQMERLIGRISRGSVQRQCQLSRDLINRLGMSAELQGHRGCVNCIEFNDTGRLLVSGSDDFQLLLWDVYSHKKLRTFTTSHTGNIFSVKFLPSCGSGLLVSGAGDKKIEVRDCESGQLLHTCVCHTNRVKRLATSPSLQHTFFSASEDGKVLQYDLRCPHQCDNSPSNVIVDLRPLRSFGLPCEVKCAALSPRDSNKLAVGANDPFVRLYDRRMIKPSRGSIGDEDAIDEPSTGCCQYYVPGHLPSSYRELQRKFRSLATTYLSYSPDGKHLLANLGGENIYLFDTTCHIPPVVYTPPPAARVSCGSNGMIPATVSTNGYHKVLSSTSLSGSGVHKVSLDGTPLLPSPSNGSSNVSGNISGDADSADSITNSPGIADLPSCVRDLHRAAQDRFNSESWVSAVMLYSEALQLCPSSALLLSNRAKALMHRNWEGDIYAALRDCFRALSHEPRHPMAYHSMAKCLHKLGRHEEAKLCMEDFKTHNTESSRNHLCARLYTDILNGVFQNSTNGGSGSSGSGANNNGAICLDTRDDSPNDESQPEMVKQEHASRKKASDYLSHYAGHCNTTTDIKEAVFLGQSGDFIAAGSDDGNLFIWETATGNVVRMIPADDNIVNCVQCHPSASLIATSGIGHTVKLWEPTSNTEQFDDVEMENATRLNQTRMNADPLEMLFTHMGDLAHVFNMREGVSGGGGRATRGMRGAAAGGEEDEETDDDDDDDVPQNAIEFLRLPRPDGGGGPSAGDGNAPFPDVQCRTC